MVAALTKKLFRDLSELKGQVITIALVVMTGVAVFIGALSTYQSLQSARDNYYEKYHYADIFATVKRAPQSVIERIREIPRIAQVDTRIIREVNIDMPGMSEPVVGKFLSIPKFGDQQLNQLYLREGRWLDIRNNHEILVGEAFAKEHKLHPGGTIKAVVNGKLDIFNIVGIVLSPEFVYSIRGADLLPDNQHFGVFWLNYDALAFAFDMDGAFNNVALTLAPKVETQAVINQLDEVLMRYGALGAQTRDEQISNRFLRNEFRQLKFLATIIPTMFLSIAAFLLNMVTGRLVALQREQIATLRAMGYSNWSIAFYYLKLVLVIVILGSILGVIFGAWMGKQMSLLYSEYFIFPHFPYILNPILPIIACTISLISSAAGALGAVFLVVRLSPSEAMRPPAPGIYHQSFVERYGLLRWFSPSFKMIARNILRKPIRNLTSALGVGFGVAVVLLGLFWNDAINFMIDAQYRVSERGHAIVILNEATHPRALSELRHMPGVLKVEGFRSVPIKLHAKQLSYQTSLTGYDNNSELRLLLNRQLKPIFVNDDQLFVSKGLASILKIKPGDWVWIDVLEGKRKHALVRLMGVVDDFVGLAAYTEFKTINRLLDEDAQINAATLLFDKHYEKSIYQQLKNLPRVATVTIKAKLIQSFENTFAKHILVFTGFLAGFAIVIAIGIVYNSARITLSERSWELASLRVLGFTRREVTTLIFGELGTQIVVGIPLGFLIGTTLASLSIHLIPADLVRIPLFIAPRTYLFAMFTILIAGILSAIIVRRQIRELNLVAVLKSLE